MGVVKAYRIHATVAKLVILNFYFMSHVLNNYPTRSYSTPFTGNTFSFFTKHHHMIRGPAHAIPAVTLATGLFITVPIANLTLISNVLYYHSPLTLKFTITHWHYSGR